MSQHIVRPVSVAYSPACDRKWRPEFMKADTFYPVYAYENGTLKRSDGTAGEALYLHFVGEGFRPCRLISSNVIIAEDADVATEADRVVVWNKVKAAPGGNSAAPADDRF